MVPNVAPSPVEMYATEPMIVSPNLGFPKYFMVNECEPDVKSEFTFYMNVVASSHLIPAIVAQSLRVAAIPLFRHDPESHKLLRGDPIPIKILGAERKNGLVLLNETLQEVYHIHDNRPAYIVRHDFFGKNQAIFWVKAKLDLSCNHKAMDWLESHRFMMLDLHQTFPNLGKDILRICYHAIVFYNSDFSNLNFAHVSDIHVARRYDEMLGMIADKLDIRYRMVFGRKQSLEMRYRNPNNWLRRFILWANTAVKTENLDFVLMTGDLIDFCMQTNLKKLVTYQLEETNWEIFLNLLINEPIATRSDYPTVGIIPCEEIAVPVFTVVGNHDVHLNTYPITSYGYYRHFGLNIIEALNYSDIYRQPEYRALQTDKYCLRSYYQHFNPFDDYCLRFGKTMFILLNSGKDSFLSMNSLLMANPKSVGFSEKQLAFAKHIAENFMTQSSTEGVNFLISHGPIVNAVFKNIIRRKIADWFRFRVEWIHPESYKETRLLKQGIKNTRADRALSFNFGTISNSWIDFLVLMWNYRLIGVHGHTHQHREFRFAFADESVKTSRTGELKQNPFAIYWDDYTKFLSSESLLNERPFDFQTPALGIHNADDKQRAGAYRLFKIRENKLKECKVHYLTYFE